MIVENFLCRILAFNSYYKSGYFCNRKMPSKRICNNLWQPWTRRTWELCLICRLLFNIRILKKIFQLRINMPSLIPRIWTEKLRRKSQIPKYSTLCTAFNTTTCLMRLRSSGEYMGSIKFFLSMILVCATLSVAKHDTWFENILSYTFWWRKNIAISARHYIVENLAA